MGLGLLTTIPHKKHLPSLGGTRGGPFFRILQNSLPQNLK